MKHLIYTLLLFCCLVPKAQTQLFTVEDGLSNKEINCILQTKNGYLWIGTASGLNFYDGYTFHELQRDNGLSYGKIKCLYEDTKGLLWIGTWDGLTVLNQKTGKANRYFNKEKKSKDEVINADVTAIEQSADGSILIGIGSGKLLQFKDENTYLEVFQLPVRQKVFKYQIYSIKTFSDSSVALLTNYATVRKLDKHFHEDVSFKSDLEVVMSMGVADEGKTLVLLDLYGNLLQVSPQSGKQLPEKQGIHVPLRGQIYTGHFAYGKNIWLGTTEGALTEANLDTKQLIDYSEQVEKYIAGSITYLYKDKKGVVWIGTNYGLIRFYPKNRLFENYLYKQGAAYKSKNSIRGLMEDKEGDIYVGGYNGLFRIQQKTHLVEHLVFPDLKEWKLTANYPYRLLDDEHYIWMTSETKGFFCYNKLNSKIEFPVTTSEFFKAYALLHNDKKTIWIGTHNGLFLFDKTAKKLNKYKNPSDLVNISDIEVTDLVKDKRGHVWISSYSSGLFEMDKDKRVIRHFSEANTNLSINFISALFSEDDSILWAGTRGDGLLRINTISGKIKSYTKKDGLADNSIAGIEKESQGNYWISTFNGLSKFNSHTNKFENYYDKDGLTDNEFNISAHLKTSDGRFFFGGLNGVNAFRPEDLKKEIKQAPMIFLTRFSKYDGQLDKLVEQTLDLSDLEDLTLSYKDKFFSFSFALDDYYDPLRSTFFYKLDGYDKDWTNLGTQNNIRFNTLPAGSFTLRIKGINSEGDPSANELVFQILVSQAFYTTWWFYLLILLITVALVFSITRYRIHQLLKIRKLRTKISSDLHDEVGSLLTRITIQAELMKQGISQNTTVEEVTKIADTSRLATAAMSDVLWSIDARNDKMDNLIDRFREHAGEILFPLEIGVEFTLKNIDQEKQVDNSIRQNLFLIFKEAIHNIAKHSNARQVTILLENKVNQFLMIIEDDGTEKKSTGKSQGQGLRNMKMRAELMEGVLDIENEKGYKLILKIKKL